MIRTELLFRQSIEFMKMGGTADYSTGGTRYRPVHECVMEALECGAHIDSISFSSDGHGGVRREDKITGTVTYTPAPMDGNYREVVALVKECGMPLDQAIRPITVNPTRHMHLTGKGQLLPGYDADVCILDPDSLALDSVMSRGRWAMTHNNILMKGRYES